MWLLLCGFVFLSFCSDTEKKLLDSGHSFVEIDARYASFKIVRKEDELTDENFPVRKTSYIHKWTRRGDVARMSTCVCIKSLSLKMDDLQR